MSNFTRQYTGTMKAINAAIQADLYYYPTWHVVKQEAVPGTNRMMRAGMQPAGDPNVPIRFVCEVTYYDTRPSRQEGNGG